MEKFLRLKISGQKSAAFGDMRASLGNKIGGVFAEWNWDGETLTLTNDRYGFHPIYYFCAADELIVSPSIAKILELTGDQEFDENAFAVFLRLGWLIAEDTLFSRIRAVPPKSVLTWRNGELKIDAAGIIASKPLKIARREAIAVYAELFQKAIEKTLPSDENFVVPLSGGRDSRHILFALCKADRRPAVCPTILHPPPRANEDARIAALICEALKLKHQIIEQKKTRFEAEISKNNLTGFSVYEHGWFLALADFIENDSPTVYDGIAGDVLSAGLFLNEERLKLSEQGKFAELADKILEPEAYLPKILTKESYRKFSREKAVNYIVKELTRHAEQPNPTGSFYFWNRTRRCIALSPFRLLGDSASVITPYLETELFDFLAALPAEMFLDRQFHTETIAAAFPEYAHLPYEKKNSPPAADANFFRAYSREITLYSMTKRNRQLTNRMFFWSRYLRQAVDKKYGRAVAEFGEQAIHLLQLERL